MNEFFTWDFITSFAGAGIFTAVLTGFFKNLVPIPTQLLAYFIALAGMLAARWFTTGGLTLSCVLLSVFNAVLVASATSGTYDAVKRMKAVKKQE